MICEKILGKIDDGRFNGMKSDYVDFEWHETYSKIHRKKTRTGLDVAIMLDDSILKIGIKPGDVLGIEGEIVIVADVLPRLRRPDFRLSRSKFRQAKHQRQSQFHLQYLRHPRA